MSKISYNSTTMDPVISEITGALTEIDSILVEFKKTVDDSSGNWNGECKDAVYSKVSETTALIPIILEKSNAYRDFLGDLKSTYTNLDTSLASNASSGSANANGGKK